MDYFKKPNQEKGIEEKGKLDLVTAGDKACERFITDKLLELYPNHGIMAEEGTSHISQSGYSWVLDPLDGTTSFAHGFPQFSISLALVNDEEKSVLGIVYAPHLQYYFEAFEGGGAQRNGILLSVSDHKSLEGSLLGTGFPYDRRERMDTILLRTRLILDRVHDLRRTGSAALDLCYVAAGELDGYYEDGLKAWDVAAAILIVKEAGGRVRTFKNQVASIYSGDFLAGSDQLVNEMSQQLGSTV